MYMVKQMVDIIKQGMPFYVWINQIILKLHSNIFENLSNTCTFKKNIFQFKKMFYLYQTGKLKKCSIDL